MSAATTYAHAEPAESARELQATYVMCRTVRHAWYPYTDHSLPTPIQGHRVSLVCDRCGMTRHDLRTRYGSLISRQYDPPADYKLSGEVTTDNLWEEYLLRAENGQIVIKKQPKRRKVLAAV